MLHVLDSAQSLPTMFLLKVLCNQDHVRARNINMEVLMYQCQNVDLYIGCPISNESLRYKFRYNIQIIQIVLKKKSLSVAKITDKYINIFNYCKGVEGICPFVRGIMVGKQQGSTVAQLQSNSKVFPSFSFHFSKAKFPMFLMAAAAYAMLCP